MKKSNLLEETLNKLDQHGKNQKDILWVGDLEGYTTWEDFVEKSNFLYNNGYGSLEVHFNLKIVGDAWWLERHEYDGSEYWAYRESIVKPDKKCSISNIFVGNNHYDLFWDKGKNIKRAICSLFIDYNKERSYNSTIQYLITY